MRWKRWIFPILLAGAVAGAIAWGLRPQPVLVETQEVTSGMLRVTVDEEGKTRIKERYAVLAPITGQMERILVGEGDAVGSGQRLTQVAPMPAAFLDERLRAERRTEIAAAESRIAAAGERVSAAKVNLEYWRDELDRVKKLTSSGDVAQSRYDQVLSEERRAAAALREAEAAVAGERAGMQRVLASMEEPALQRPPSVVSVPVVAPVGGRVLRLVRESAGPVTAGEPLVEIGNARAIEVEVELLSTDAVKVGPGTRVLFTRWGGEKDLEGRVQQVKADGKTKVSALGVEEQRVPVTIAITSPEEDWRGLGAGYRVEASFVLWEEPEVLQISSSAVFRYEGGSAVFVVDGGAARRRAVKLGQRAGLNVQVLEGLRAGERIVSHPDASIEDGTSVLSR